jgi:hypothetical protein
MATYNFVFTQGESVEKTLILKRGDTPIDLTGMSFRAECRVDFASPTTVFQFNIETMNATQGILRVSLPSTVTRMLAVNTKPWKVPLKVETVSIEQLPSTRYLWDMFAIKGSYISKILSGGVLVLPAVTRNG